MSGKPKVMHVDDDPNLREITRMSLELVGDFELVQFDSGLKAVAEAEKHDPDLILLDIMMPELDGLETFKLLRKVEGYADKPIVFMTAKASQADNEQLMELGAVEVIFKPFDPMELPDKLRAIMDR